MNAPNIGIHRNVSFAEYVGWPAVNASRLSAMLRSPAHYLAPFREATPAMAFGTLAHNGVLEPEALEQRYAVLPRFESDAANVTAGGVATSSKATRYYKDRVAAFVESIGDRTLVSEDEYLRMLAVVRQVSIHPVAGDLFRGDGHSEVSLLWEDDATGLLCKARIDRVTGGRLVDLKTTKDVTAFSKSFAGYGYHRQLAHYQAGWIALTGEVLEPWIVAVESDPPHCVAAAPVDEAAIYQGERERQRLLAKVAECEASGVWPGPASPECWELPEWAVESIELIGV